MWVGKAASAGKAGKCSGVAEWGTPGATVLLEARVSFVLQASLPSFLGRGVMAYRASYRRAQQCVVARVMANHCAGRSAF